MIKVTYAQLEEARGNPHPQFNQIGPLWRAARSKSVPIRTRCRLGVIKDEAIKYLQQLEPFRIELLEKHGVLNDKTGEYDFKDSDVEAAFHAAAKELYAGEVEISGEMMSIDDLELKYVGAKEDEENSLSGDDMRVLKWLFKEFHEPAAEPTVTKAELKKRGKSKAATA